MDSSTTATSPAQTAATHDRTGVIGTASTVARGVAWVVSAPWYDRVVGPNAPNYFGLEAEPDAAMVKTGRGRSAWRVNRDGADLFCKVYERAAGWRWVTRPFVRPVAAREFEIARAAFQRGISVPEAVAWGRQTSRPYKTVVLLTAIDGTSPLTNVDRAALRDPLLSNAVAALFAKAHDAGFVHRDGHPGNVLVRRNLSGTWAAWFVDMHEVKLRDGPISTKAATAALGTLEHHYARSLEPRIRLRFFAHYWKLCDRFRVYPPERRAKRAVLERVRLASRRTAVQLAWRRDRRLRRSSSKYFTNLDLGGGWTARVALNLGRRRIDPAPHVIDRSESDWRRELPAVLDRVTRAAPPATPLARCDHTSNVRLRHETFTRLLARIRVTMCGPPARRAFEHCHRLRHRDLPAPIILGYAEHRRGGLIDRTVLILPNQPDPDADDSSDPDHHRRERHKGRIHDH